MQRSLNHWTKRSSAGENSRDKKKKVRKASVKVNNHGYPAGCICCADIDLFHTCADRSNSYSHPDAECVKWHFHVFFPSIRLMWVYVQISTRHAVSSLLHAKPRIIFHDNALIVLELPLIKH